MYACMTTPVYHTPKLNPPIKSPNLMTLILLNFKLPAIFIVCCKKKKKKTLCCCTILIQTFRMYIPEDHRSHPLQTYQLDQPLPDLPALHPDQVGLCLQEDLSCHLVLLVQGTLSLRLSRQVLVHPAVQVYHHHQHHPNTAKYIDLY